MRLLTYANDNTYQAYASKVGGKYLCLVLQQNLLEDGQLQLQGVGEFILFCYGKGVIRI